jgi:hypothetical protein
MSTTVPPSPPASRVRRPSWLDLRLVVGVLLVLGSVVLGARLVTAADRSVQVWALARDVAAGTTLADADLRPARVRLFDSAPAYLQVARSPAGHIVSRAFRAGELLPAAALAVRPPGLIVSIPVRSENAPSVARGQLVDVWSTPKGCSPVRVVSGVAVQEVRTSGGALSVSTGTLQVIVRVGGDQAERIVTALGTEATIRLVVLDGAGPNRQAPAVPAESCRPAGLPAGFRQTAVPAGRRTMAPAERPRATGPGTGAGTPVSGGRSVADDEQTVAPALADHARSGRLSRAGNGGVVR